MPIQKHHQLNSSVRLLTSKRDEQNQNPNPKDQIPDMNFLDNSRPDTERRPTRIPPRKRNLQEIIGQRRRHDKTSNHSHSQRRRHDGADQSNDKFDLEWGVETIDDPSQRPHCPSTLEEVADEAFDAITSTLYLQQKLDPNIVSNAMAVSVADMRPVGFAAWPEGRDVGRLGIEIDGARYLLRGNLQTIRGHEQQNRNHNVRQGGNKKDLKSNLDGTTPGPGRDLVGSFDIANSINDRMASRREYQQQTIALEGRALRRLSLILASQLSQGTWEGLEDMDIPTERNSAENGYHERMTMEQVDEDATTSAANDRKSKSRPVALFFNTLRQTLLASKELQLLQKIAKLQNREGLYDNIRILCLGQDGIPQDMVKETPRDTKGKQRRKWGGSKQLSEGMVNPKNGMILIVQPTDFNSEANPAAPVIGTVQQLQMLLARASIAHIPAVVISPRLTEQFDGRGIEQSGYQRSSTYGGLEVSFGWKGNGDIQYAIKKYGLWIVDYE